LITLFLYWELMAIVSTVVIWCGANPRARAAGIRYALLHLLGGVVLKVGIEGITVHTKSIDLQPMLATDFDTWMLLIGILINAATPPLAAWLSDAYPASTPTGSVFLSAFTTKTAVLALLLLFPGEPVLIGIGLAMALYGIVYALLESDGRRLLAYTIVNQVGIMVCAVGLGTPQALNGAAALAVVNIVVMGLLFMTAGAVVYRTGGRNGGAPGGLVGAMPVTALCAVIGGLAISGVPLFAGFAAFPMLLEAASGSGRAVVYFLLLLTAVGVWLHAGLRYPWLVFFRTRTGPAPQGASEEAPWNMRLAMVLFAALSVGVGVYPDLLYRHLPYAVGDGPYSAGNVIFTLEVLGFAGLAFVLARRFVPYSTKVHLDADWLWRVAFKRLAGVGTTALTACAAAGARALGATAGPLARLRQRLFGPGTEDGSRGTFARSWPIGTTALWIAVLLSGYVLAYYF
ncbi:MAG: proton-conducting transporter membrane subunit, partial [Pseudomonadota bacterium]